VFEKWVSGDRVRQLGRWITDRGGKNGVAKHSFPQRITI